MKRIIWIAATALAVATAYALNLFDVSMGNPATLYHVLTTAGYIAFWALYLALNKNERKRLTFSCVISGVTFLSSCAITVINFAKIVLRPGNSVLILTFFSTPFYGVRFLVHNMAWCMVAVTILSLLWLWFSVFLRKRIK
ncbi:MAG: hypothetical protein FWE98_05585 [Oscillospiraceae bacterium]|nr:hypothetical protein [Oscillospiraceae bacterium]